MNDNVYTGTATVYKVVKPDIYILETISQPWENDKDVAIRLLLDYFEVKYECSCVESGTGATKWRYVLCSSSLAIDMLLKTLDALGYSYECRPLLGGEDE